MTTRDHGRILCKIWQDKDFRGLPRSAQALYMQLLSQPTVNNAGVLPLQVTKWVKGCAELTVDAVWRDLGTLSQRGFIVVDNDETEEVLIRSFIRHDGGIKHKYILKNALKCAESAESPVIRKALAIELYRLKLPEASRVADILAASESDSDSVEEGSEWGLNAEVNPSKWHSDGFANGSGSDPGEGMAFESHSDHSGVGEGVGVRNCSDVGYVEETSSSAKPPREKSEPYREDVEALCARLRDRIAANGSKATVTDKWRTEARLMLDRDGREFDKAMRLIEWCQDDSFWRGNILSMPKFRAQYDQLRLKANETRSRAAPSGLSKADQKVQGYLDMAARMTTPPPPDPPPLMELA
ncbi:hypothetical protein ACQP1O_42920 (plasmid) [Nocardia sp. CA-151230]|uniref:hypothetical protein n=1 Tax=Nocardia sp. CA-151230 TaxID=3239982 RepID=UPI003D9376AC